MHSKDNNPEKSTRELIDTMRDMLKEENIDIGIVIAGTEKIFMMSTTKSNKFDNLSILNEAIYSVMKQSYEKDA
ncbi:MAG: hypothetical protein MRZ79_12475 [Bacteroidia bacterium]|nr:hypothetical protein [Bacteroidia bacterium]